VSTTEALLDSAGPDAPVRQVLVGAFWTAVVLETDPPRCGLASTIRSQRREMNTKERVLDALRQVMHPELERDLVDLEMIQDVIVQDSRVAVTLAVPFIEVPIVEDLIRVTREAAQGVDPTLRIQV
jgi:metal-sulfur cluster biosynthetic enzyme